MDALETLMTTRSMRRYTDEPVSVADIETCLAAAQQAPSGGNVQPQQYVVVTDPDTKARLAHWYLKAYDRYEKALPVHGRTRRGGGQVSGRRAGRWPATSPSTSPRSPCSSSSSSR